MHYGCQIFCTKKNNGNLFFLENLPPRVCRVSHTGKDKAPSLYSALFFFLIPEIPFRFSQIANSFKSIFSFPAVTCAPEGKGVMLCQPNRNVSTIRQHTHCVWIPKRNSLVDKKGKEGFEVLSHLPHCRTNAFTADKTKDWSRILKPPEINTDPLASLFEM